MKTRTLIKSLTVAMLTIAAAGCGNKNGTYTLSQSGNPYYTQCASMSLNLTSSSGTINATGSNGICTENLIGTESNNTITVSQFTVQVTNSNSTYSGYNTGYSNYNNMPQCNYTGTLAESGNTFSGTLTSPSNPSLCLPLTIQGTKTN